MTDYATSAEPKSSSADKMLLTEADAAAMLSVCRRTMFKLRRDGKIKSVQVGSAGIRYAVTDLQAFIDRNRN